jgi:inhibitor of cysteine peptidase
MARINGSVSYRCRLAVCLVMAALLLAGCATMAEGGLVRIDASRNGTQIELAQGTQLVVDLDSNPTTGYRWEVLPGVGDGLRQVGEADYHAEGELIGSGGVETFTFQAVETGVTDLQLVYRRSWETGVAPARSFSLRVMVR